VPRRAGDAHLAAEKQGALLHAEQAERFAAVEVAARNADAVVRDFELEELLGDGEVYVDTRRARILLASTWVGEVLIPHP